MPATRKRSHGCTPPRVVPGRISCEAIAELVQREVGVRVDGSVRAPGTLKSHYSPRATVLLVEPNEISERAQHLVDAGNSVVALGLELGASSVPGVTVLDA